MLESKSRTGTDKLKTYVILNGNFLSLSCPSATFALQHGGFVPREWLAAKGLLWRVCVQNQHHWNVSVAKNFSLVYLKSVSR